MTIEEMLKGEQENIEYKVEIPLSMQRPYCRKCQIRKVEDNRIEKSNRTLLAARAVCRC